MVDRVIADGSFATADSPPVSGTPQRFTSGDPAISKPATVVPGYHMDCLTEEPRNVVLAAGLIPDRFSESQLWQALLTSDCYSDTGTTSAFVVNPPLTFASSSLKTGTSFRFIAAHNPIAGATLNFAGLGAH